MPSPPSWNSQPCLDKDARERPQSFSLGGYLEDSPGHFPASLNLKGISTARFQLLLPPTPSFILPITRQQNLVVSLFQVTDNQSYPLLYTDRRQEEKVVVVVWQETHQHPSNPQRQRWLPSTGLEDPEQLFRQF